MSGAQLNSHLQNVSAAQLSAYFSERERHSERRSNERISVKLWLIKKLPALNSRSQVELWAALNSALIFQNVSGAQLALRKFDRRSFKLSF